MSAGASVDAASPPGTKLADILKFLDDVEASDDTASVAASLDASRCGSVLGESVVCGLKRQLDALREKVRHRDEQLAALRKKTQDLKARDAARAEAAHAEMERQRSELEGALARSSQFASALLADKEALNARVGALSQELHSLTERHEKKIAELEERHLGLATAQKAQLAAGEKRRRSQWQEEQTKRLKAEALKALEPDIAQLMNRHRAEKQRLENERDEELRRRDALLAQKDREMDDLRRWMEERKAQDLAGKEAALEQKDRELLDQRTRLARDFEQSLARERELFQQQVREQAARGDRQLEEVRQALRESREREAEAQQQVRVELAAERASLRAEKAAQIVDIETALRQKLEEESQARARHVREELEAEAAQAAVRLRAQMEAERDAQIALVIQRLEDTALQTQKGAAAAEKAWQDKYHRALQEREAQAARVEDLTERVAALTAAVEQRQKQAASSAEALRQAQEDHDLAIKDLKTKLLHKVHQTDELWSTKFAARIQEQTEVIERQAGRICELQRRAEDGERSQREAREAAQREHERELAQLKQRVQQALAKKDATIQELQGMVARAEERHRQIEEVLLSQSQSQSHSPAG